LNFTTNFLNKNFYNLLLLPKSKERKGLFIKKLTFFSLKYYLFSLAFFFYYNSNINFTLLSYFEARLVNLFFNDKIINYPSIISGEVYAIYNEEIGRIFVIDKDCLAINMWLLLLIFVFSYPVEAKHLKKRLFFLVISFFIIEFSNIFRLSILYYLFLNNYKLYILFHEHFFQIFEIIVLITSLIFYLKILK